MLKYALFALPGPGDAFLKAAAGRLPEAIVHAEPDDFSTHSVRRIPAQSSQLVETLKALGIELILVAGWERRIAPAQYEWLSKGAWNIHPSLLPKYRGHNPYFWAIANGETETGVTIHQLTPELDCGPILLQMRLALAQDETIGSLWKKLGELGAAAALEALDRIERGDISLRDQPEGKFLTAPMVTPDALVVDSSMTMEEAERRVRAANPFYGAAVRLGNNLVRVFETSRAPEGPEIACRDGKLFATVIQAEARGLVSGKRY